MGADDTYSARGDSWSSRRELVLKSLPKKDVYSIACANAIDIYDENGYDKGLEKVINEIVAKEAVEVGRTCGKKYDLLTRKNLNSYARKQGYKEGVPKGNLKQTIDYLCAVENADKCDFAGNDCDGDKVCDVSNYTRDYPHGVCIPKDLKKNCKITFKGKKIVGTQKSIDRLKKIFPDECFESEC